MTGLSKSLQRPKSLTALALDEIRGRITRGELPLGAPLSENALAAELGVSKTPIREALLQLKTEGLVSVQPQRGSFVFDMTGQEVSELSELRETIEVAVLERAMARDLPGLVGSLRTIIADMRLALVDRDIELYRDLDAGYHRTIIDHCGNRFMLESYDGIAFRIQALRVGLSKIPGINRQSLEEHAGICDLIERRDLAGARALLVRHIGRTSVAYISGMCGSGAGGTC